jgi:type II secretory pathway pseudopilin PulG
MVEIAISLAIIGFALVAIIGVLPLGMNVQKDNREETIINQDETVLMNAIRNGAQGLDDLTNYVMAITNYVTVYDQTMTKVVQNTVPNWYTTTNSFGSPQFPLTSGSRIVGLLSTPKYLAWSTGKGSGVASNHVVAYVRSMSGPAFEKFPQKNPDVQDLGFSYRMTSEVLPYGTNYYDPSWTNYTAFPANSPDYIWRYNYWLAANNLQASLHDVRLTFLWPLLARGRTGNGGQAFRTLASGQLLQTYEVGFPQNPLYFFQPQTYVKSP